MSNANPAHTDTPTPRQLACANPDQARAHMAQLQRGDVVEVRFGDGYVYRGLVFSATKRQGVYVITRGSGYAYFPEAVMIGGPVLTLVERRGRHPKDVLWAMREEFA